MKKLIFWVLLINSLVLLLLIIGFLSNTILFNFPVHVDSPNYSIYFSPSVLSVLNKNFVSGVEHKVCLDGSFVSYHNLSFVSVVSDVSGLSDSLYGSNLFCSSVGSIHNHVKSFGSCRPSIADINTWKIEASKGTTFFIIQCDIDKFVYFTSEDLYNGVLYDVK